MTNINAVIETHRAALHAIHVLNKKDSSQEEHDEASERESDALFDLLTCVPSTIEEAALLLDYVATPRYPDETILQSGMGCSYTEQVAQKFTAAIAIALQQMAEKSTP